MAEARYCVTLATTIFVHLHNGQRNVLAARKDYCFARRFLPTAPREQARYVLERMAEDAMCWPAWEILDAEKRMAELSVNLEAVRKSKAAPTNDMIAEQIRLSEK